MGNMLTAGSRVSENRERGDDSDKQLKEEDDVKMEDVHDDSERIEDYVMSEVSSLRDNFEEIEVLENGFHVGDFVWGEGVNGQRWWPGQIYDSSHASALALKTMQKGKLLVAYFGDGSFSWCNPLELKPFLENFNELSKMSGSRGFLNAVEEAVREIGERVEQFLVCDDAAALVSSVAVNSGVKDGVVVPDIRREIVSSLVLENPGVVLDDVKGLAKTVSYSDLLEFEVLKRNISAFYRCEGRSYLAKYDEHQYIIGLEDKEDESFQLRSLRKCSGFVRKIWKCGDVATTGSPTRRWRRLSEVSKIENAEEELNNGKSLSSRKRKSKKGVDDEEIVKREESNDSNHLEESEKKDDDSGIETDVNLATPLASLSKRLRVDVSSSVERNNGNGETLVQTGKRERKKSKYLSPEYMTDFSCRARKSKTESAESRQIRVTPEKAIDFVKLGATSEEMLDLIRGVALSKKYPEDYTSSCDMVREFVSMYRSFTYHHGANNKIHERNLSDGENQPEVMDEKEQTRDEPNEKQFSGVELFIKTELGSTLPSKDDLIKTYKKFGPLDMGRSYTFDNNSSALIAFLNVSDGEEAFNKSLEKCPFAATSTVTFKLKYPSSASSPKNNNEKSETETRKSIVEIECVKEKLEEMRSLLDQSEGMITEEVKMKLQDESRNLLDKVSKMIIVRPS